MNVYCCNALCLLKLLLRNVCTDFTHWDNGMLMFRLLHAAIGSDPLVRLELRSGFPEAPAWEAPRYRSLSWFLIRWLGHVSLLFHQSLCRDLGGLGDRALQSFSANRFFNTNPYFRTSFEPTSNWPTIHYRAQNPWTITALGAVEPERAQVWSSTPSSSLERS